LKASAKRFHQFPFMIGLLWVAALAFSPAQPQLPHSKVAALSSRPGCITAVDDLRDPAWQRDSILLLCYCGVEDLLRAASTGQKQVIGFDILQLNAQLLCSFIVAFSWVAVATLTGVLGEERYNRGRVLLTWAVAAPIAAALRLYIFDGTADAQWLDHAAVGAPGSVVTDAVASLLLLNAIRIAEERGFV